MIGMIGASSSPHRGLSLVTAAAAVQPTRHFSALSRVERGIDAKAKNKIKKVDRAWRSVTWLDSDLIGNTQT